MRQQPENIEHQTRQRLLESAVRQLAQEEFSGDLLSQASAEVGCTFERAQTFFRSSEDLAIALYSRFAADLEARILELPDGTLAERFAALMKIKFALMSPYAKALEGLANKLSDHKSGIGVLSAQTEIIRLRVQGVLSAVVLGASDFRGKSADSFSRSLYTIYLGLMWLWFKDKTIEKKNANAALKAVRKTLQLTAPLLTLPQFEFPLQGFDKIQRSLLMPKENEAETALAKSILETLFKHRRLLPESGLCAEKPCGQCLALHLPKIKYFLSANRPIHFLLPAFPAKSPDPQKTLGALPDMAERQAMIYLEKICREIKQFYAPGVRLTICSDGHVFSDLVGVGDDDVTLYGLEIKNIINRLDMSDSIDTFNLNNLYEKLDYPSMRRHLVKDYAQTLEELQRRATLIAQTKELVNGIQRFLFEDQIVLQPEKSRTKIRNECRALAYEVVQRSDAWGRLLADCFPAALRLSIHPQNPHSEKIGILLGEASDVWLTPWHGAAVKCGEKFTFMKRHEAEKLGARLVYQENRPVYFEL